MKNRTLLGRIVAKGALFNRREAGSNAILKYPRQLKAQKHIRPFRGRMNGSGQALPDGNMASGIAFGGGEQLIPVTIYANARNTEAVEVPDLRNARDFAGIYGS